MRRLAVVVGLITALSLTFIGMAWVLPSGSPPPPPRPAAPPTSSGRPAELLYFNSDRTGNMEIFSARPDGSDQRQLTTDPNWESWWARISPDRTRILFYRMPKGTTSEDEYTRSSLWMMNADGSGAREVRPVGRDGWDVQGHAEWAPDGRQLVMFGGANVSPQIFITDSDGQVVRQITDRGGTNIDPSWAPDGSAIVFVGCPIFLCFEWGYEIYTVPATGGAPYRLTRNLVRDHDPYYAPDGTRVAWLGQTERPKTGSLGVWNIYIMRTDGSEQRMVTDDGQINSKPQWSPDGSLIYFHRFTPGMRATWSIFSISPTGDGMIEVLRDTPGNSEYPSI